MFEAHAKRQAAIRVSELKNSMVSGVWGNPNFDEGEQRDKILRRIDEFYEEAVATIYGRFDEVVIDENDPFFAAMKRPPQLLIDKNSIEGIT